MTERAYLSNLSPLWPFARQEDALRDVFPAWPKGVDVFRDNLPPKERRRHSPALLSERETMLRPTSRPSPGRITVASLAVLAWHEADMLDCLAAAALLGLAVRALDVGLEIGPASGPVAMQKAAEAFRSGRRKQQAMVRGEAGGRASGDARKAEAIAKCTKIKERWALPNEQHSTADLLAEAGVSYNTAKIYLGKRPLVQAAYQAAQKRAVKRAARAEKEQA